MDKVWGKKSKSHKANKVVEFGCKISSYKFSFKKWATTEVKHRWESPTGAMRKSMFKCTVRI